MAERELLDAEWARLKQAKEDFEAEKQRFEQEKRDYHSSAPASGGFGGGRAGPDGDYKLFVGNLSSSTDENGLSEMFTKYGTVKETFLLRDKDGKSKRSAFVKFSTKSEADRAIAAVHDRLKDEGEEQAMVVRYARKKQEMMEQRAMQFGATGYGAYGRSGASYGMDSAVQSGLQAAALAAAAAGFGRSGADTSAAGYGAQSYGASSGAHGAQPPGFYPSNPYGGQDPGPGNAGYGPWGGQQGAASRTAGGRFSPY